MLVEPDPGLSAKTWARLSGGTPLVTAARQGKGLIVLFHVTADTTWSNLPLAAGLASDPDGESLYPVVPGGSASTNSRCAAASTSHVQAHRQYKSDQVHVRDILERLAH